MFSIKRQYALVLCIPILLLTPGISNAACVTRTITASKGYLYTNKGTINVSGKISVSRSSKACGANKKRRARKSAAAAAARALRDALANPGNINLLLPSCTGKDIKVNRVKAIAYSGLVAPKSYERTENVNFRCN